MLRVTGVLGVHVSVYVEEESCGDRGQDWEAFLGLNFEGSF